MQRIAKGEDTERLCLQLVVGVIGMSHELCWPHAMSGWYAQPCTESAGTKVALSFDRKHHSVSVGDP